MLAPHFPTERAFQSKVDVWEVGLVRKPSTTAAVAWARAGKRGPLALRTVRDLTKVDVDRKPASPFRVKAVDDARCQERVRRGVPNAGAQNRDPLTVNEIKDQVKIVSEGARGPASLDGVGKGTREQAFLGGLQHGRLDWDVRIMETWDQGSIELFSITRTSRRVLSGLRRCEALRFDGHR